MIGSRLGAWVIDKELGRGGMGRVYLAHEEPGGRPAAVKVLAAELAQDAGFLQRFQREIEALRQLDHPNIVRFQEAGVQDGIYYYVMELIDGPSFEEILHEHGRLPWPEVLDAALQICPALKHAHDRGIIHRDLKPPNLLRTRDGVVKLTDFGIAKVFASNHLTATGGIVGTAEFLSPEQAAGKPATKRSDLYSLGAVLYMLVTGRPPFEGETFVDLLHKHRFGQFDRPQKLVPELPYELDEVICELLEKDPSRRPADGLVLQRRLESIRRKLERKAHNTMPGLNVKQTVTDGVDLDGPGEGREGQATMMSRLVRQELQRQNQGGPVQRFFNHPVVLVLLLLFCVGVFVWTIWFRNWDEDRPEPNPERKAEVVNEAQRIFELGVRHQKEGNLSVAERDYEDVIHIFQGVESEEPWVRKARNRLAELRKQAEAPGRWEPVKAALARARKLRDQGQRAEAEQIWRAVEERYGKDPSAGAVLQEMRRDRGK